MHTIETILQTTPVSAVMTTEIATVESGTPIVAALRRMISANVGSLVVVKHGGGDVEAALRRDAIAGLAPIYFAVRKYVEGEDEALIDDSMIRDPVFVHESDPVLGVVNRMGDNRTWRLIVVDGEERVTGVISATDVHKLLRQGTTNVCQWVQIGRDTTFFNLTFVWYGRKLAIVRQGELVTEIDGVMRLQEQYRYESGSKQHVLLLTVDSEQSGRRVLFIDADPVQTNVREVDCALSNIDETYAWLLPQDFLHRQGDVGIYARDAVPGHLPLVPSGDYERVFEPAFSGRHVLVPVEGFVFYSDGSSFYVEVLCAKARIMHPEHHPVELRSGFYEIREARGIPLPSFSGLRDGEKLMEG
ncbi:CBS domain-containing protein [Bradyrhizobium sp. HKCCYLS1011]|uniref:CBS domain-containing protein n=1 Tax=Bradyrhizobium sp. HKCCYLS1011 TaxID=3420733 RepID=UPI003EBAE199